MERLPEAVFAQVPQDCPDKQAAEGDLDVQYKQRMLGADSRVICLGYRSEVCRTCSIRGVHLAALRLDSSP
jgi:hypothetical protein